MRLAEKKYAKGVCFCGTEVPPLANWNDTFTCQICGAKYWAEDADDLYMVDDEATDLLGLPLDQIEIKIIHNYDEACDGPEDPHGTEVCLVFARLKPAASA